MRPYLQRYVFISFTGMENLQCIIHYNIKNANCSKIKPISEINQEKIYAAKSIWKSKGGNHHHKEQCDAIPSEIDPSMVYISHLATKSLC